MTLLTSLTAYWRLDGDAVDTYAAKNGTVTGATATTGKVGQGYLFNGTSSDYITMPDNSFTTGTTDSFTFNAWINMTNLPTAGNRFALFGWNPDAAPGWLELGVYDSGASYFTLNDSKTVNSSTVTMTSGTWYMLTAVYDNASSVATFYINGVSQGTATSATNHSDINSWLLGRRQYSTGSLYFKGKIDEVGIWARAITQVEVTQLYNGGSGLSYPFLLSNSLSAYWKQEDANEIYNPLTGTNTSVTFSAGKISNCGVYNGSAKISFADTAVLRVIGDITIAGWLYYTSGRTIISKCSGAGSNNNPYDFGCDGTHLVFVRSDAGGYDSQTSDAFSSITGGWHHVAVTHNITSNTLIFYVDGAQAGSTKTITLNPVDSGQPTLLGARADGQYLTGKIDELGLWSRVLTPTEIAALYNSNNGKTFPFDLKDNIICYYNYNSDAKDATGTFDGTVTGASNVSAKMGNGYSFSGSAQHIDSSVTPALFDASTKFSVAFWMNPSSVNTYKGLAANRTDASIKHWFLSKDSAALGLDVYSAGSSDNLTSTGLTLANGTWYHVVYTFNAGAMKIYVNGSLNNSKSSAITAMGTLAATTMRVGWNTAAASTAQDFYGLIDEFGVWNRELTAAEVTQLYNSNSGFTYPFVVGAAPSGWTKKFNGIVCGKIGGVAITGIAKVNGV